MEEQLVWLINAKSDTEVNMSIVYKTKLPEDAVYRGNDDRGMEVYNTATSPDRDYRPVVKDE